ncbi:MAG: helix-turn-helix domain-containing protein [Acidobacteriales bacterium]|nr:helix-turn-helix domain-containing protein [Terriglobales bacterium]
MTVMAMNAVSGNIQTAEPRQSDSKSGEPLLIDSRRAAAILSISERTLWDLTKRKAIPGVVYIGRLVRYSVAGLSDWIAQGCPNGSEQLNKS